MVYNGQTVKEAEDTATGAISLVKIWNSVIECAYSTCSCKDLFTFQLGFPVLTITMPYSSVMAKYCKGLRIVVCLSTLFLVLARVKSRLKVWLLLSLK